jgi:hypothetical protein
MIYTFILNDKVSDTKKENKMQSNAKAIATARELADVLQKRLAGGAGLSSVAQSFDANNWPVLTISNGSSQAAGQPVVVIQIANVDAVSKDIFGNQTYAYAPHIMQLGYELGASGNQTIVAHADLAQVEFEAFKMGMRIQIKEVANGTAVTAASVSAAAAVADLDNLYWPTKLA